MTSSSQDNSTENEWAFGFDEYQLAAAETAVHPGSDEGYASVSALSYLALGLGGETGEVQEKIKKIFRDKAGVVSPEDREEIIKELGDVLWYMARLADVLDEPLEHVALKNLAKLRGRKERLVLNGSGDNR